MTDEIRFYTGDKVEPRTESVPCSNCGKPVEIILPFYGCVFCRECSKGESFSTADASEFKPRVNF